MRVPQCQPFFHGMRKWNSNFILFFVFLRPCKTDFYFHFHFSFFIYPCHWKTDLIFVRFHHTLKNGFEFQFLFSFSPVTLKKRFEFRFSYFVFRLTLKNGIDFRFRITMKNIWHPLLFRLSHKLLGNFWQLLRGFSASIKILGNFWLF